METNRYYTLVIYVPTDHVEQVKEALFKEGAGRLGNYERCAWQTVGTGCFRPVTGSNPTLGTINHDTTVEEWRVEMICEGKYLPKAIEALKLAHPYEVPAYTVTKMV